MIKNNFSSILMKVLLVISLAGFLAACGGGEGEGGSDNGSSAKNKVTGRLADGYLVGAKVCIDLNANSVCDLSDPFAITTQGGNYVIDVPDNININNYSMIAEVTVGVVDEDDGKAIDKGYILSSPAGKPAFISPISTLIHSLQVSENLNTQQAAEKLKLKLGVEESINIFADYIESNEIAPSVKTKIHVVAKITAKIMAENYEPITTAAQSSNLNSDTLIKNITDIINKHIVGQLNIISEIATDIPDQNNVDESVLQALDTVVFEDDLFSATQWNEAERQIFQVNLAASGAGSTLPPPVSNGKVCTEDTGTETNTLSGLKYCINIVDSKNITRYFNVSSEKQNTLIYVENIDNSVNFLLYKKINGSFSDVFKPERLAATPGKVYRYRDMGRLVKGEYKIVFKEDLFSFNATAEVHINSNAVGRVYTEGLLPVKAKVAPYKLVIGQQISVLGTLQAVQDNTENGSLIDVIPLRASNLSKIKLMLDTSKELDVSVVNAVYLSKELYPSIILPQDGVIWQGKSGELVNQSFVFTKQTSEDAYYVVISEPFSSKFPESYKFIPNYSKYKLIVTTQAIDPVILGVSTASYNIKWSSLSLTNLILGSLIRKTDSTNNLISVPDNEFLSSKTDAKDLTSALQTLQVVMSFDEGAVMRFYDEYIFSIDGVNNSAEALYVTEELTTLAIDVFQVLKKAGEGKNAVLDLSNQVKQISLTLLNKSQNDRAQVLGTAFLQYGFNVLREYQQKKAVFINRYQAGNTIVATDRLSFDTVSDLTKLYMLQQRASLFIQYGMNVYLSLTNLENRTLLEYYRDRVVAIASAFIPDSVGTKTIEALSTIDDYTKIILEIGADQFSLTKIELTMEQVWNGFLDVDNYHSFYTPEVQDNSISLLIQKGLIFDLEAPLITLNGSILENITQNSNYTDAGATAVDGVDGSVTIYTSGVVDVTTVGTYTITYQAADAAGNESTLSRTVNVEAVIYQPTITTFTPLTGVIGEITTFTLTGSDFPSNLAMSIQDATSCTAPYSVTSSSAQMDCVLGGVAGKKDVTIQDQVGGNLLDASYVYQVAAIDAVSSLVDLSAGLVAHYEFEGNANDTSGNGNNGIEYGGVTYTPGAIGQAASFDGVDDYIEVMQNSTLDFQDQSYSVTGWINIAELNATSNRSSIFSNYRCEDETLSLRVTDTSNIQFSLRDNTSSNSTIESNISLQNWIYVSAIRNADSNKNQLYINGLLASEVDDFSIGEFITSNNSYWIGSETSCLNDLTSYLFKGLIDDLRIYNRSLNSSEITQLYNLKPKDLTDPVSGSRYINCTELQTKQGVTSDGNYIIDPDLSGANQPFNVYCYGMDSNQPTEYINLVKTGEAFNFGMYKAGGARPGTDVFTHYTKIKIDPNTLLVDINDRTFSTSRGSILFNGVLRDQTSYGVALDCISSFSTEGRGNINLEGTPFSVSTSVQYYRPNNGVVGYNSAGVETYGPSRKTVDITGGGYCGGNLPQVNGVIQLQLSLSDDYTFQP